MLTHLNIKNFAAVQSLSIDLHKGLSVITGETGAGKSIAVDALGLVLGDRADNGIIRDGTERAEISASFDISNNAQACQWLDKQGLENEECILRRVLSRDGRSRAFINGSPATLGQLREIGESLIDIHSQHEHQSLLNKASHRRLLDAFSGAEKLAIAVLTTYQQWHSANTKLTQLKTDSQTQIEQYQLLRYQLEELDAIVDDWCRIAEAIPHQEDKHATQEQLTRWLDNEETFHEILIEASRNRLLAKVITEYRAINAVFAAQRHDPAILTRHIADRTRNTPNTALKPGVRVRVPRHTRHTVHSAPALSVCTFPSSLYS